MIAPLELVVGMELTPQACVLCANNPIDEATGQQQEAIFAPGVDVNWGDSVYICKSCGEIIADLLGRTTKKGFDRLKDENEELKGRIAELEADTALLERIRDGKDAVKEAKRKAKVK
jgi:hypothetical protein